MTKSNLTMLWYRIPGGYGGLHMAVNSCVTSVAKVSEPESIEHPESGAKGAKNPGKKIQDRKSSAPVASRKL
jgi:hypothetical protein